MPLKLVPDDKAWPNDEPVKRRLRRWSVTFQAVLWLGGNDNSCLVRDISPGGARIELDEPLSLMVGASAELAFSGYDPIAAEIRHVDGNTVGLMFTLDSDGEAALGRHLVELRPDRTEPRRTVQINGMLTPRPARQSCMITNIPKMGARITGLNLEGLSEGDEVSLHIDGHGDVDAVIRRI